MKKLILIIILCLNLLPTYRENAIHWDAGQFVVAQPIPCPPTSGGKSGGFFKAIGNFFGAIGNAIGGFFQAIGDFFNQSSNNNDPGESYGNEGSQTWDPPYAPDPGYDAGGSPFDPSSDPFFSAFDDFFSQYYDNSGNLLNPSIAPPTCPTDVKFKALTNQAYGFDDYTNSSIPWKSVESNHMDPVRVEITPAALYANVFIKSMNMSVAVPGTTSALPPPFDLNVFAQYLTAKDEVEFQANCGSPDGTNLAKLNVAVYPKAYKTVAVILVNSAVNPSTGAPGYTSTDISDATLNDYLNNKSYNQGVVEWTITRLPAKTVFFDNDQDGKLDISTWLTGEMSSIVNACKDDSYDANIFLVDNPSVSGVQGIMNFNQKYGFVFVVPSDAYNDVAHELGHGTYGFTHQSSDNDNIMYPYDGSQRTKFRKFQWDIMH
jgi:hypothetical protein